MTLKFNSNVTKRLQLRVRKFWELIPIFAEVIRETLVVGTLFNVTILICDTLNTLF